jgi:chemotaxis protein CheC
MGSGHATTALSEIVRERIMVEVPRVHVVPPHLVPKIYGMHNQPMTVIYMQLRGEPNCDFLLAFEPEEVKNIVAIMTMASSPDETSPEMEAPAMQELGSIMICSFLTAVADFADIKLVPAPPQLITDTFACPY